MKLSIVAAAAAVALAGLAWSAPVLAAHARAGLWKTTTTDLTPAGDTNGKPTVYSGEYCRTPAEAAHDAPQVVGRDCMQTNVVWKGNTVTGETVCGGPVKGKGRFSQTFPDDIHYSGTYVFDGHTMMVMPFHMNDRYTAVWVKADCGKIPPLK